jgi:hypothetical protein
MRCRTTPNVMMLRSAEADPHVIEHASDRRPKPTAIVAQNRHAARRAEAR